MAFFTQSKKKWQLPCLICFSDELFFEIFEQTLFLKFFLFFKQITKTFFYLPKNMWREENNALVREYYFKSFSEAFAFMTRVAFVAERINHHPTIINSYNKVELRLNTHEKGYVVTDKDWMLAKRIDDIPNTNAISERELRS